MFFSSMSLDSTIFPRGEASRRAFLRRVLGGSAGVPFSDVFERVVREVLEEEQEPVASRVSKGDAIRVAVVGLGNRGSHILRSHGYWPREELEKSGYGTAPQPPIRDAAVTMVCDVYEPRVAFTLDVLGKYGVRASGTTDWHEVIESSSVDAVIVATADLWHTPIAVGALQAGKDVYVEKCMSQSIDEAKALRTAVRRSKQVLQVGHQNRHNTYQKIAARLVKDGVLGHVGVLQASLGRNNPAGAYAAPLPSGVRESDVRWDRYLPPERSKEKDLDKLFNWRRYWGFSTGIAGDLLSHDVDMANRVLELTIPDAVVASGGIYGWKDGRETPDTYSVVHEYTGASVQFLYNATLANSFERKTVLLGSDATLVMGFELHVYPDHGSSRYADELKSGKMNPYHPFISFEGPAASTKLVTSPTAAWADGKGLTFTDVEGQRKDVTRLALEEFYENVRTRRKPVCGVDEGFAVSVACDLGTRSYREGRRVRWDPVKEDAV